MASAIPPVLLGTDRLLNRALFFLFVAFLELIKKSSIALSCSGVRFCSSCGRLFSSLIVAVTITVTVAVAVV